MNRIIFYIVVLTLSLLTQVFAQETFEQQAKVIAQNISKITAEEKEALKKEVEEINKLLESSTISNVVADERKIKVAEQRAKNIEIRVAQEQSKLDMLVKNQVEREFNPKTTSGKTDSIEINGKKYEITYTITDSTDVLKDMKRIFKSISKSKSERRTTSQFVFAFGLNNVITEGSFSSLDDSDFRVLGSHFYEWGVTWNTRIFKNDNLLHAKYGFSFMYNNLRPTQNRYFVKDGNQTFLETANINLNESRLRNVQLVLPLHLEFDLTPKKVNEDGTYRFRTHEHVRFGIGGYTGLNFKTKQILRYREDDILVRTKERGDFNASNFVYGLSAYLGCGPISLYAKYDLNPLFKNNPIEQNNVSFGLRFDFN
jgi:hypothetical protein